jgi:hypothetical protein
MPAVFRRLGPQTVELCNGRRVNTYHIVDSCVVSEERPIFPVGPFLFVWVVLGLIVTGALGVAARNSGTEPNMGIFWAGLLLPALLLIKRTHYSIRVTGSSGEVLLFVEVPEGAEVASQMADGLMREVEKTASFNVIEPYRPDEYS